MRARGSRYELVEAIPLTSGGLGVRARDLAPATGVLEHVVSAADRLDLLALQYYNDDRLWWRILDANPGVLLGGGLSLADLEGETLLIPRATE